MIRIVVFLYPSGIISEQTTISPFFSRYSKFSDAYAECTDFEAAIQPSSKLITSRLSASFRIFSASLLKFKLSPDDRVKAMQRKQQAEAEQETIKVQNETKILEAEAAARAKQIEADAEAKANKTISESLTDELLRKMEMEARMEHGWITVQGADTIVSAK